MERRYAFRLGRTPYRSASSDFYRAVELNGFTVRLIILPIKYTQMTDFVLLCILMTEAKRTVRLVAHNFISMPRFYMRAEKGTALISDWREETKVVKCKYWHESDVLPVETAAGLTKTMVPR